MATDKKISELPVTSGLNAADISLLVRNGVDYQFTIAQLLQYLNSNLFAGASIAFGTALPQNSTGKDGDVFLQTNTGRFAQKLAGTWSIVYQLPEANGADGTLLYGAGIPGSGTGKNGDSYINTLTGVFYQKSLTGWSQVFSMQTGPQGPKGDKGDIGVAGINGKTILSGASNPVNLGIGTDGDFYINTSTLTLFGPKTAGVWGAGTSMIGEGGAQGEPGLAGPAGPAGATGPKGDKGDTGATGAAGPKGDTGSQGPQGLKGDKGDTGATGPAGPSGTAGASGSAGQGVAEGGSAGQVLSKVSNADYNTQWVDPPAGVAKASLAEINAGTDDAKFTTSASLEASKYTGQSGAKLSATATGTNAYTAVISPVITAYANTQRFYIRFSNANTTVSCTIALNGLTALPLVKGINTNLAIGDILADSIHLVAIDGTNARILSLSSLPVVTSGEKVVTITAAGPQKTYDLQELTVNSAPLTAADFSSGIASVNGSIGQFSYDANYRYDCIGINQWRRSALNGNLVELYLADIDDTAGDKTSADLQSAYPASLIGQQVWGVNKLYIKKTSTVWKKLTITTA